MFKRALMAGLPNCHKPNFHTINHTEHNRSAKEEVTNTYFTIQTYLSER